MNPWGPNPWGPPAGYYQPGFAAPHPGYWAQSGWAPPNPNGFSTKYPNLHPILASDTTQVKYDVRNKARNDIPPAIYAPTRGLFATASSASHIRLVSERFPWTIDIVSNSPVTVEAIWDAIYAALQQHIADSEWGFIVVDKKLREAIKKTAKKRAESDGDSKLKRIDYLGGNTIFKGLDRIDDFADTRLLPGTEPFNETWVVKLGSS